MQNTPLFNTLPPNTSTPIKLPHHISVPKIIFFDIDDTLSRDGVIAPHNKQTLEALSQTDIKLVIATGRSKSIIPKDILALLDAQILDAIICTNGQYNFVREASSNDTIISHYPLTMIQANRIAEVCNISNLIYKFDSDTHLAWSTQNDLIKSFNDKHPNAIVDPHYHKTNVVYQCSAFFNDDSDKLLDLSDDGFKLVIWHHMGGDILPMDASKARAVQDMCQHFGLDVKEAMAFGDGFNDIEMFDLVGCAVAMGDAQPALIEHADIVTKTIEEKGIQAIVDRFL